MAQRTLILLISFVLIQGSLAAYLSKCNTTITIPDGVTYHPESQDICTQTSWTDVVSFFVGNYLSHVATVVKAPGEPLYVTALNMFLVLLFPCYGTGRGLIMIYQRASFYKDPLQQALKAQALVMVIRDQGWKPQVGDSIRSLSLYPPKEVQSTRAQLDSDYYRAALSKSWIEDHVEKIKGYAGPFKLVTAIPPWLTMHYGLSNQHISVKRGYHVSGACDLPEGYQLAYVPPNAQVERIMPEIALCCILQSSYSLASGVISIVQIVSACSALYQSRGHQITAYGYAAFGFTVTPYLVMSFLNLLANCFNPSFPNLYLVHTEVMDEAISRGGHFTDIVGKLESEPLVAEDLTVFSASFKQRDDQLSCQIANQMFHHGSTEPILVSTTDHDSPEKDAKYSVSETTGSLASAAGPLKSTSTPDKEIAQKQAVAGEQDCRHEQPQCEHSVPTLIVPGCYRFKVAYSNTSSTSILHKKRHYLPRGYIFAGLTWALASITFIPLGVMSKFRPGNSTFPQRAWVMAWYAVGIVSVSNPYYTDILVDVVYYRSRQLIKDKEYDSFRRARILFIRAASILAIMIFYVTPAIGGFAVVGLMLIAYGSCKGL